MSAREMERCECRRGHAGPLVVLVDVRCSAGCGEFDRHVECPCCEFLHVMPFVTHAEGFRTRFRHAACDAQALLVLEPLDAAVGVGL